MKLAVDTLTVEASDEDQKLIDLVVEDLCGVCKIATLAKAEVANAMGRLQRTLQGLC